MLFKNLRIPRYFALVLLCFLSILDSLLALALPVSKRDTPREMSTSIIIPCDILHFPLLFPLLEYFQNQTTLFPDEIVISLSNTNDLYKEEIYSLENHSWPFSVKIISHRDKKSAGLNRNIAAFNSSKDILICQDADDLPHPQRVEIIKYMFETYDIDHLFHSLISYHRSFTSYETEQVPICTFLSLNEMFDYCNKRRHPITNGNVSFTRDVIKNIPFPDASSGEDVVFNEKIYCSSYKSATILAKLLMYRAYLSLNNPGCVWPTDIDF